jgi:hypothetical protein
VSQQNHKTQLDALGQPAIEDMGEFDVSCLESMLRLTPAQRLERMESMQHLVVELMRAGEEMRRRERLDRASSTTPRT